MRKYFYAAVVQCGIAFFFGFVAAVWCAMIFAESKPAPEHCKSTYYVAEDKSDYFHVYICR